MVNSVIFLGTNLNRARITEGGKLYLILDGREKKNPSAMKRYGLMGKFEVTKTEGRAPGDVSYWGFQVV